MPVQDFGRVADIYDATRSLPVREMGSLVRMIERQVGRGGTLIDIGVGTGRFAKPLQDLGLGVSGVDISKGMIAKAREKGVRNLTFADVHHLPFRDKVFDASLLVHILHLVGDWSRVVRETARVTRVSIMSVTGSFEGISMEDVYLGVRKQMGYPLDRFEGERGLLDRVRPVELIKVGDLERKRRADEEIERLLRREQSMTWDLPEEAHQRVIADLRSNYGGKILLTKQSIELAVWTPDLLQMTYS